MDISTFIIVHQVLVCGGVRKAAEKLGKPVSSVSAALIRLQSNIAMPLTITSGNRILATLEGQRITTILSRAAELVRKIVKLSDDCDETSSHQSDDALQKRSAKLTISLPALQRFIVTSRCGSIRRAAMEIPMGQPQLTRQIKHIESEIGTVLLERSQNGISLTPQGAALLTIAEELDDIWLKMSQGSSDRFRRLHRTVRLGSVSPLSSGSRIARMSATLVAEWSRNRPQTPLFVSSGTAEELLHGLKNGHYDLALIDTDMVPKELPSCIISRSSLAIVGSSERIHVGQFDIPGLLSSGKLVLPSARNGLRQKTMQYLSDTLSKDMLGEISITEMDIIPVIANLVMDHDYITVLPQSALSDYSDQLDSLPLPPEYDMQLLLVSGATAASQSIFHRALSLLKM
ncbi:LysR family transcriptional regulator [Rhizobium sp. KVB221]|uniref:LysR family transcriptional regulator n=1 Tax=Rhizobium setariae TaxID=2801340 RepID=A0A936YRE1_9HYPH|nr:LysR family transcriptional regulator [Rhizobium setariae]MBL0375449.1 LysR family transcriptional regulator [Rhizobium setariae]